MYIDETHRPLSRAEYEAIGRRARSEAFHAGIAQIARIFRGGSK